MSEDLKTILFGAIQFLIAAAIGVGAFELYLYSATHPLATESWIEVVQEAVLLLSGFIFMISAWREKEWRGAMWLIHGFFISLFIRELDAYFDVIHHGAWKYVWVVSSSSSCVAQVLERLFRGLQPICVVALS